MSVSESLGRLISPISRARGASYFRSGAVRSLSVENRIIEAQVRGTSWYTVWIETGHPLLRASCNCPYFIGHADICKHIFAVILAAEAGHAASVPDTGMEAAVDQRERRRSDACRTVEAGIGSTCVRCRCRHVGAARCARTRADDAGPQGQRRMGQAAAGARDRQ